MRLRANLPALSPAVAALAAVTLLQACSGDDATNPSHRDTTPPARVSDLSYFRVGDDAALIWTAPGDDGDEGQATRYDIRYAPAPLTEAGWDSATAIASPPTPEPAGETQSVGVSGLPDGRWHFGLKTADEVPNWSPVSNVVSAVLGDTIRPSRVTDLTAISASPSGVTLRWTAPGDDGKEGRASDYDFRYATEAITEGTWNEAVQVQGVPTPSPAGTEDTFTVSGLERGTTYFFGLKGRDEAYNWSELSNVVRESTSTESVFRLTFSSRLIGAQSHTWSPDAQRIAFAADWDRQYDRELYAISADGGVPVRLTQAPNGASDTSPSWSPDGEQLVFNSSRSGTRDLWIMDAVPGSTPRLLVSHGEQQISGCDWSPDGGFIAYTVVLTPPPNIDRELYIIPSTGGAPERLLGGDDKADYQSPSWSPDGTQIAFASNRSGNFEIWTIPSAGGDPVPVTDDPSSDSMPDWSPDGSRIVFASKRDGGDDFDIWTISPTGENPTQLTSDPTDERLPAWSPDGSRISYYTRSGSGPYDVWILYLE